MPEESPSIAPGAPVDWAHAPPTGASAGAPAHALDEHLHAVGQLSASFAPCALKELARLAGLWHDLGKRRPGFQRYIRTAGADGHIETRIADRDKTHSAAGALWAIDHLQCRFGRQGALMARLLQYVIAGHHAGLADWEGDLSDRLEGEDAQRELDEALARPGPESLLRPELAALDDCGVLSLLNESHPPRPGRAALWLRMLFSSLVDADFLDTEAFFDPLRAAQRAVDLPMAALGAALDAHLQTLMQNASGPVNTARARVLQNCRDRAALPPGVFRLTVPTGGGKTLASLAFALAHASSHKQQRIVYAIPYTSIIEQTAEVFRQVFASLGDGIVLEHHGNVETDDLRENHRSRLACDNWDAPLVVTTNVQLFESLFARKTSRCRKLHNLQQSVIVLDEAQLLPLDFLQPIVDVLRYLVQDFGVTVLLCTATQPVLDSPAAPFDSQRGLQRGLGPCTDIVDDVPALYAALQRVCVHLPPDFHTPRGWPEVADGLARHACTLAIVNRRADAAELHRLLQARISEADTEGDCHHLSALMCPQHRSDTISHIKAGLQRRLLDTAQGREARPLHVVSTQLVEAGVDLDFPVVYRALAGVDAIAQAAGRCNREGRLAQPGEVHVFVPPTASPPGLLRLARDTCKAVWHDRPADPLALDQVRRYFERLLHDAPSTDRHGICRLLQCRPDLNQLTVPLGLRSAADAFRLIDNAEAATVIVRYRSPARATDVDALLALLTRDGPARWLLRKLQRYGVTVYRHQVDRLLSTGDIEELPGCPGLYAQREGWDGLYDPVLGLRVDSAPGDPALVA